MYEELRPPGSAAVATARERSCATCPVRGEERAPWKEWALAIASFGVYAAVIHYRTNRELRDYGIDVDPTTALFAFFPGALVVVPYLVTVHRTADRIGVAQETAGLNPSIQAPRCTVTSVFAFLHIPYQQSELNRVWRADALQEETS